MENLGLFILLLVALAIGYGLGRFSWRRDPPESSSGVNRSYIKGLNYLLNEEPDAAIDAFVQSLEVDVNTLETHLALGKLLRRRGEVERAIRIHQNLLARPSLPLEHQHQAQYELAKDYFSAGLLDRAERLLQELIETSSLYRDRCLDTLIRVYRDEKDWEKAIHAASLLSLPRRQHATVDLNVEQAHFCCELAEQALEGRDYLSARRHLKQALDFDRNCVRSSLLWGRLEYTLGNHKDALKILKRIPVQDETLLPESLELICQCYDKLGDRKGLLKHFEKLLRDYPSSALVLQQAECLRQEQDEYAAARFIGERMKEQPTLRGILKLAEIYLPHTDGAAKENLELLHQLLQDLLASKPSYRCDNCGFSCSRLYWLCPKCKQWGTIRGILGLEGI